MPDNVVAHGSGWRSGKSYGFYKAEASVPPYTHLWHMWPGKNWPATAAEEADFVDELRSRSGGKLSRFDRSDVTSVLNSLRCGLIVEDLFYRSPGLSPGKLLAAYERLELLRALSVQAWESLVLGGSIAALHEHAPSAKLLLPTVVRKLFVVARTEDEALLRKKLDELNMVVLSTRATSDRIEEQLSVRVPPDEVGVELGMKLYDPYEACCWGDPHFVPRRVGELVPVRVADLLGERQ